MELHDRLAFVIEESNIKRIEFARRLNITSAYVSQICAGSKVPSDRTIKDICSEFSVSEKWLKTGEGEMFVQKSREHEISAFIAKVLSEEPESFRQRFISVLTRLSSEEWELIERMAVELVEGTKKADP